jgi:hypothetical protein
VTREDFRSLLGDGTASEKREEQSFSVLRSPVAADQNDIGNEIFLSVLWFCFFNFRCQLFLWCRRWAQRHATGLLVSIG